MVIVDCKGIVGFSRIKDSLLSKTDKIKSLKVVCINKRMIQLSDRVPDSFLEYLNHSKHAMRGTRFVAVSLEKNKHREPAILKSVKQIMLYADKEPVWCGSQ